MESFYAAAPPSMEDLLDFSSDIGEEEDTGKNNEKTEKPPSLLSSLDNVLDSDNLTPSFPDSIEEELEWISNKDAFPSLESFVGVLPEQGETKIVSSKHSSPVSVLENSSSSSNSSNCFTTMRYCSEFRVPGRSRSKCPRKPRKNGFVEGEKLWWSKGSNEKKNGVKKATVSGGTVIGRKCLHCGSEKTPQWRAGPMGPKTLCNACGVRYKSGRLVPEYRPANSPTFSSKLHSNSHRKVMEIRKQKQMQQMGMVDNG